MTITSEIKLAVDLPQVAGDTVWFTWSDNAELPTPPEGGLFYRFENLDLTSITEELWMEVFLALRLGTYARLKRPVTVTLPVAVPATVIDYWRTYHGAHQVRVTPISSATSYEPLRTSKGIRNLPGYQAAVYFGGGRESLAAACLLGEIYGREQVLLIQCVDPFRGGEARRRTDAQRFESLSLGPARDVLGFATQRVWTNLHDIALNEGGKANEPHLQQYTAGLLPSLLLHRIRMSTSGYPWQEFVIIPQDKHPFFRYPRSRPEMLAAETRHRQVVCGFDHQYINVAMTFIGNSAFKLLAHRYPDAFPFNLSCVLGDVNNRWCHGCKKCGRHTWHNLEEGLRPPGFSLDRVMSDSPWIKRFLDGVAGWEAPPTGCNSPFTPRWAGQVGFGAMCESFYRADPGFVSRSLRGNAWLHALTLQTHYGNRSFPAYGMSPSQAYRWLPGEVAPTVRSIVGEIAPIVDELQPLIVADNDQVEGPFARPFEHALLRLAHIQPTPS